MYLRTDVGKDAWKGLSRGFLVKCLASCDPSLAIQRARIRIASCYSGPALWNRGNRVPELDVHVLRHIHVAREIM